MITFKQFFNEATPDIDITATGPGGAAQLGTVDQDQADMVANYVDKLAAGSESDILDLIRDSQFDTAAGGDPKDNKYFKVFDYLLFDNKYKIDWQAFKEHKENRFRDNNLKDWFSGQHGQFNLFKDFAEPILSKFVKANVEDFFKEIFVINPQIGGTAVGDGEFVLGILGNGIKGNTGDVDLIDGLPIDHLKIHGADVTLEVGTNDKIIGASSRESGYMTTARNIVDAIRAPVNEATGFVFDNHPQKWQYIQGELGKYDIFQGQNLKWLIDLLKEASKEDYKKFKGKHLETETAAGESLINRFIGSIVLYDYIIGHNDDIIVSIYYASNQKKLPGGYNLYDVRWANLRSMNLEGTVNFLTQNDWYNFNISPAATRFTFGT